MRLFGNKLDFVDRVLIWISRILRFTIVIAIITALINQRYELLFSSLLILVLTFLPDFFEHRFKIDLPTEFEILAVLFIYGSLFLGEIQGYYTKLWWWDIVLHIGSGILLGLAGVLIMYALYYNKRIKANPLWLAIFSFSFALALGVLWEIFEFSMDSLFGLTMQKSGLVDTMWDLIVNSLGALFAAVLGYFYVRGENLFLCRRLLVRFVEHNPHLFKKKSI